MDPDVDIGIEVDVAAWSEALDDCDGTCRRAVLAALEAAAVRGQVEVGLLLTDDGTVRDLNRTYRGKDGPTNVLSFPGDAETPPGHPRMLGDIALAYGTVAAEAAAQGKSLTDHVAHLIVHGTLHLLGYDHGNDHEAEAMEGLETAILAGLGIADPYREAAVARHDAVRA